MTSLLLPLAVAFAIYAAYVKRRDSREERPRGAGAPPAPCSLRDPHPAIVRPYSDWVSLRIVAEMGAAYAKLHDVEPVFDWENDAVAAALASPRKGGGHR